MPTVKNVRRKKSLEQRVHSLEQNVANHERKIGILLEMFASEAEYLDMKHEVHSEARRFFSRERR